jgi:hypothetical protein
VKQPKFFGPVGRTGHRAVSATDLGAFRAPWGLTRMIGRGPYAMHMSSLAKWLGRLTVQNPRCSPQPPSTPTPFMYATACTKYVCSMRIGLWPIWHTRFRALWRLLRAVSSGCNWRARDPGPDEPSSERELNLYRQELKRLRSKQRDQDRLFDERRKSTAAYLDEAIALAHPIALRLLAWLHVSGRLDLGRVFEVFGASSSTFEGLARLHLIGALKFDDGDLTTTSLGRRVLNEFGILDPSQAEDSELPPPTAS